MHVHLPKPLHGWRAFFGEVGIIVLGVLVALSAEQLVEKWNWHRRAEDGRERLRAEVGHAFLVAEERVAVQRCIDDQLTKIEDAVLGSGAVMKPLPVYPEKRGPNVSFYSFRAPTRIWPDSTWRSIISEGLLAHLTRQERALLPVHYADVERLIGLNAQEGATIGDLAALSKPLPLDAQVKASFIGAIEQERERNAAISTISAQMMRFIGQIGYVPPKGDRVKWLEGSGTIKFCRARGFTVGGAT